MITNNDLILLLTNMIEKNNHADDCKIHIRQSIGQPKLNLNALKFINDNRKLEVVSFYDKIRASYNAKKSKLYINLMKELTEDNIQDVLTTLSSYLLQVNLFSKNFPDNLMFFKHARVEEVTEVLNNYYKTLDILPLVKLLKLIKTDIVAFDYISGRKKGE